MKTLGETITGFVVLIVTGNASAAITITKIADTNTAIPNGSGNFTGFGAVSLDGQDVAFRGLGGSGQDGEYLFDQGVLNRIADTSIAIPNGVGNFMNFSPISLDSGNFAFVVGENNRRESTRIWVALFGKWWIGIRRFRQEPATLRGVDQLSLDGGTVAFLGTGTSSQDGIYTETASVLTRVVDTNTAIPDGTGKFTTFQEFPASFDGGSVAFLGSGSSGQHVICPVDHREQWYT